MRLRACAMTILAFGLATTVHAQSVADCQSAIVFDRVDLRSDDRIRLAQMSIIDRSNFTQKKQNVDTGGGLVIDGLPLNGYLTFENFDEARSREYQYYSFKYDRDHSLSFMSTMVSGNSRDMYLGCLKAVTNAAGVHVWAELATAARVELRVKWVPPVKGGPTVLAAGSIKGLTLDESRGLVGTYQIQETKSVVIARPTATDRIVSITLGGYAGSVMIAAPPVLTKVTPVCVPPDISRDPGWPSGRSVELDFDGDGCNDGCRITGNDWGPMFVECNFPGRKGKGAADYKVGVDAGYPGFRWWVDINRDGRDDYCRVIGNHGDYKVGCALSGGRTLGGDHSLHQLGAARGKEGSGYFADVNKDGYADFCRAAGDCLLTNVAQVKSWK